MKLQGAQPSLSPASQGSGDERQTGIQNTPDAVLDERMRKTLVPHRPAMNCPVVMKNVAAPVPRERMAARRAIDIAIIRCDGCC